MDRKTILSAIAASIISAGMSTSPANADGVFSFDVGGNHVCIGLSSCLFQPKKQSGRDSNGTADHRGNTTDHRDIKERKNTVVVVKPRVRDHRTKITVRDHRDIKERENTVVVIEPKVRDHRTEITVRDHRS